MEATINFNEKNFDLTIKVKSSLTGGDFYLKLFDKFGEIDIIQVNEIKQNYVAMGGIIYELDDKSITQLQEGKEINLSKVGTVEELADEDFIEWYY